MESVIFVVTVARRGLPSKKRVCIYAIQRYIDYACFSIYIYISIFIFIFHLVFVYNKYILIVLSNYSMFAFIYIYIQMLIY